MKTYLLFVTLSVAFLSCGKAVEQAKEDLVVKAMTDGQWRVTKFIKGPADVTSDFSAYKFQFRTNNTVEAINNNAIETTGTWNADATSRTISSAFSAGGATLTLLNGTWLITNNSWTFVEASQTVNGEVRTLRLDK